jgi:kynurenine formamidase
MRLTFDAKNGLSGLDRGVEWKGGRTMKTLASGIFVLVMVAAVSTLWGHGRADSESLPARAAEVTTDRPSSRVGESTHAVTQADFDRWKTELSNWGRWGKDDQIGALNLITPAKRRQAAALVKEGFSVSLASDANTEKAPDNPQPYELTMETMGSDKIEVSVDKIAVSYHGNVHTHIDSLAHVFFDGKAYNGYAPVKTKVMKAGGHARNSIYNVKNGIFTRGILIDIPRLKGVPYLEPSTPIYVEDLEAWEKKVGVKVSAGDALFVRTGRWPLRKVIGPLMVGRAGKGAGLDASVIPWLKQRDIAVLAGDGGQSVSPAAIPAAVHDFMLISLGVHVFDQCDLEAVSEAAAARNRWEFLLTVAPLPIRGATGSPINPIATF